MYHIILNCEYLIPWLSKTLSFKIYRRHILSLTFFRREHIGKCIGFWILIHFERNLFTQNSQNPCLYSNLWVLNVATMYVANLLLIWHVYFSYFFLLLVYICLKAIIPDKMWCRDSLLCGAQYCNCHHYICYLHTPLLSTIFFISSMI